MRLKIAIVLALTLGAGWLPAAAQQRTFVPLATGGTAGVYFPLGAALAEVWTARVTGVQATAQTSAASVANVNLLARGDVAVAFIQNDIAFYAFHGIEMFKDHVNNRPAPIGSLRGMAMLYPETIQVVTLKGKGITSIADLLNRRVAVGPAASGTEVNARQILRAFGLGYYNIREDFLSFAEAADQLKDGVIDAAFITAGFPTAAVQDVAASRELQLLPVPREIVEEMREQYPYYASVTVPAGTYRGQDRPVQTAAVMAMLVTRQDASEQLVYDLTKAMWDNIDRLQAAHARGRDISFATSRQGMPITMHAGALRYYRERGIR